jgi:hypothetical protein
METIKTPKYAGGYNLNGSKDRNHGMIIMRKEKPIFIHRWFSKLLLGWVWIDEL